MKLGQLNCMAIKFEGLPGSGHILLNLATPWFFWQCAQIWGILIWAISQWHLLCHRWMNMYFSIMTMEILAPKTRSLKLKDAVVQEGCLTLPCDVHMGHSLFVPVALCCRVFNMVHSLGVPACRNVFSGCSRLHCGMLHLLNWFLGSHFEPLRPFVHLFVFPFSFKIHCHSGVILEIERYVKRDESNFFSNSSHHRELDRKDCNMHHLTVE